MRKSIKLVALILFLFLYPIYSQINIPFRDSLQKTSISSLTQNNQHLYPFLQAQILKKSNKTGGEIFLLSDETDLIWDTTNLNWENSYKYSYSYDANNNLADLLDQEWDGANWVNYWKYSYTYDSNNKRIVELDQQWDGANWVNNRKYSYTYDPNNKWVMRIDQFWVGDWYNTEKILFTFDANNNMITVLDQYWNAADWVNFLIGSYTYDTNSNLIMELMQDWDGVNWVNSEKQSYTYEGNINLIVKLIQDWDGTNWVNVWEYSYTYDGNNNRIVELDQQWDGANWVNVWRCLFAYMQVTGITGQSEIIPKDFSLSQNYPNPFNPSTTISYTIPKQGKVSLKVFNVLGSEVAELVNEEKGAGSYQVSFDATNLSSGVYFYRIKAGDFVQTKKMILLK